MKNIFKTFGIIAIVAVMGFSFVACDGGDDDNNGGGNDDGTGGTFTLTDIPSQYNGKYAMLSGSVGSVNIGGFQSYSAPTYTLCPISNGSVSLPMWYVVSNGKYAKYSGNDTATFVSFIIHSSQTATTGTPADIIQVSLEDFTFSNGNASKSWNDRLQ